MLVGQLESGWRSLEWLRKACPNRRNLICSEERAATCLPKNRRDGQSITFGIAGHTAVAIFCFFIACVAALTLSTWSFTLKSDGTSTNAEGLCPAVKDVPSKNRSDGQSLTNIVGHTGSGSFCFFIATKKNYHEVVSGEGALRIQMIVLQERGRGAAYRIARQSSPVRCG